MDKSGDGRLSLEEIIEGFKEIQRSNGTELVNEDEIRKRFQAIDQDKSNYIEIDEFIAVTINEELLFNENNLKLTFDYFDKDKSGELDTHEIHNLLQSRGTEEEKQFVISLIDKYDTNKDG